MADKSRRCAPCDLNLPLSYKTCPVCSSETFGNTQEWEQSWVREAERLKRQRRQQETGQIPNAVAVIVDKDGYWFVAEQYLLDAGYDPQEFDVVKINGTYFELC